MTLDNVTQALLYALTTITCVSALAVALFGGAGALERWLDRPLPARRGSGPATTLTNADLPAVDPPWHSQVA